MPRPVSSTIAWMRSAKTGFDALTIGIRYGFSFKSFRRRY
jgi:hypothetical protein